MPSSSRTRWVIACAAAMLLAGCGDTPDTDAAPSTGEAAKAPKALKGELPPEMVAAVSSARNSSVVSVHFVLKGNPAVSKALPVDIAIVPHERISSIYAHFDARDGLALATGNVLERQVDPAPEKVIKHQLILLPAREGVFMVTAVIETESQNGSVSRVFSIPVIVAPPAPASAVPPPSGPPTNPASG